MNLMVAALVRSLVIGALLTAYTLAIPVLFPDKDGGANIGAGLLAFAGLALVATGWALVDGLRTEFVRVLGTWGIVAAIVAFGWHAIRAVIDADDSLSALELMLLDLSLLPFEFSNLFVPALVGAGIGAALSGPLKSPRSRPPESRPGS